MRRVAALLLAALALGAAAPATPPARPVPTEDNFTRRVAERFRAALPGHSVTIAEPLALAIRRPGETGEPFQVYIGRIFNICRNEDADACEVETANFIRTFATHLREGALPATRAQLRVAVRHRDYCTELDRLGAGRTDAQRILARRLAPDLCEVLMIDYPDRMRGLNGSDLPGLSLSADEAWALGTRQTLANLPQLTSLEGLANHRIVAVSEYEYIPTLLLRREDWRALTATHGPLLVAVPADEALLVVRAADTEPAHFRTLVRELFRTGRRPISESVYRWTETGWVLVED